ncbi:MAG TPA: hypothetical protein DIT36_03445 [Aquificaceae bacterium]|jgi:superfamily II DNA or RNA helicase|nr:hypothetical protein [Aquificaceae bacterium]
MGIVVLKDITEGLNTMDFIFDFKSFSKEKTLYNYQQEALKNCAKVLWKYYKEYNGNKEKLASLYEHKIDLEVKKKVASFYQEYGIPIEDGKVAFKHVANRMSFWMATGSGKTLVIVKLIEMLKFLMDNDTIPKKDILFLTPREDLIEQFKRHVEEFNRYQDTKILLYDLKEFGEQKAKGEMLYPHEIRVFYYRSDLLSDEQKEKILDFRNYENDGNWYIILDEAHKGDKEDSKRQHIYNIMARNGFLFNFSATFTDSIDYITCVYNFNLAEFVKNGYGKHVYVSKQDLKALGKREDFNPSKKQLIILKLLILLAYLKKVKQKVKDYYHHPLMVVLVNSVNTEDSDLELFFKELRKVAIGEVDEKLFEKAKEELKGLLVKCEFSEEEIALDGIEDITLKDVLEQVFNSPSFGEIEYGVVPENRQEIVFKLKTSDRYFALIKVGDISNWIKEKLEGYERIEEWEEGKSYFRDLENSPDINILMGSRAFYEGWDSNRPNIILFINIGTGTNAKKFVLQSVGRGVRIEPVKDVRRRIEYLYANGMIDDTTYQAIKPYVKALETLFVFGTKGSNLRTISATLKGERQDNILTDVKLNPEIENKLLLVPEYKDGGKDLKEITEYKVAKEDLKLIKEYLKIKDTILLAMYDFLTPVHLRLIREAVENGKVKMDDEMLAVENALYHFKKLKEYVEK